MTRLSRQISLVTTWDLPAWSAGPVEPGAVYDAVLADGYEGVQVLLPPQAAEAVAAGVAEVSAIGQARDLAGVDALVELWGDEDVASVTVHLGTGFETAAEARRLLDAFVAADAAMRPDLLVETHRATLFQDPARAIALAEEHPSLRFTADLSHWYTGAELPYGDLEAKLVALAPVLHRARMIHARISDPGCIQVAVGPDDTTAHVTHFRRMWATVLDGCAAAGVDVLPVVVELLPAASGYARRVDRGDGPQEEVDRWEQARALWAIASDLRWPTGATPG